MATFLVENRLAQLERPAVIYLI